MQSDFDGNPKRGSRTVTNRSVASLLRPWPRNYCDVHLYGSSYCRRHHDTTDTRQPLHHASQPLLAIDEQQLGSCDCCLSTGDLT
jgi:hypothetical protein